MATRVWLVTLAGLLVAVPTAMSWKGDPPARQHSIAEVQERAESGDYVVVEGQVVDVSIGSGSRYIANARAVTGPGFSAPLSVVGDVSANNTIRNDCRNVCS